MSISSVMLEICYLRAYTRDLYTPHGYPGHTRETYTLPMGIQGIHARLIHSPWVSRAYTRDLYTPHGYPGHTRETYTLPMGIQGIHARLTTARPVPGSAGVGPAGGRIFNLSIVLYLKIRFFSGSYIMSY